MIASLLYLKQTRTVEGLTVKTSLLCVCLRGHTVKLIETSSVHTRLCMAVHGRREGKTGLSFRDFDG